MRLQPSMMMVCIGAMMRLLERAAQVMTQRLLMHTQKGMMLGMP